MFTVSLYIFYKRENSTLVPDNAIEKTDLSCQLKSGTGVYAPVLRIRGVDDIVKYNYASIGIWGRYYFVKEWRYDAGIWEVSLVEDVLASWKTLIGVSEQYVLRSSFVWDEDISDGIYPTKSNIENVYNVLENPWAQTLNGGTYVLGIINSDDSQSVGGVNFYYFTNSQIRKLNSALLGDPAWLGIAEDDLSQGIQKALINPFQYITSVLWFPFDFKGSGEIVSDLEFGWWNFGGIDCIKLFDYYYNDTFTFPINKHPDAASRGNYLNNAPFSRYTLDFKPFGSFPIDSAVIYNVTEIVCNLSVDMLTGKAILNVTAAGNSIAKLECKLAVPLQLSQIFVDTLGATTTAISAAGNVVSNAMSGNIGGAISSFATGINDTVKSQVPQMQTSGSTGSMADFNYQPQLHCQFYRPVDDSLEHRGRPLCQEKVINQIPGYIMVADADLKLPGTQEENLQVKAYMEGGFFYE